MIWVTVYTYMQHQQSHSISLVELKRLNVNGICTMFSTYYMAMVKILEAVFKVYIATAFKTTVLNSYGCVKII